MGLGLEVLSGNVVSKVSSRTIRTRGLDRRSLRARFRLRGSTASTRLRDVDGNTSRRADALERGDDLLLVGWITASLLDAGSDGWGKLVGLGTRALKVSEPAAYSRHAVGDARKGAGRDVGDGLGRDGGRKGEERDGVLHCG